MTQETQNEDINKEQPLDFSASVERLEGRANRSRRRVLRLTILLAFAIASVVAFLLATLSLQSALALRVDRLAITEAWADRARSVEDPFSRHIFDLMDQITGPREGEDFIPPTGDELASLNAQLDGAIARLERIRSIIGVDQTAPTESNMFVPVLITGIFSFGVIGIIILIINICISFLRYHSQLAELYESQANALKASGGSAELAYRFAERFSPTVVVMGKTPASLYEKALDVIKDVSSRSER